MIFKETRLLMCLDGPERKGVVVVNIDNELSKQLTCCFSGYRPEKLPWGENENDPRCRELKRRLLHIAEAVYQSGRRHFLVGMARGCDMYFCEAALLLRDIYPDVTVEAVIPCEEQAARWSEKWRNRYFDLIMRCDVETYVSRKYTSSCMLKRNRHMVDRSSVIITVFDGRFGGTMSTRRYASKKGIDIIDIMP